MCIIVVKNAKLPFPNIKTLETCYINNPDGAGFMFIRGGRVNIHKGFMSFNEFLRGVADAKLDRNQTVVYHFRIATSGGETAKQCHPFPITKRNKDLMAGYIETDIGFAHNGIIDKVEPTKTLSDTMIFIKSVLAHEPIRAKLFRRKSKEFNLMNKLSGASRLLFLNKHNYVYTGDWKTDSDTGLLFSNSTYEESWLANYYGKRAGAGYSLSDFNGDDDAMADCPRCKGVETYSVGCGWCYECGYEYNYDESIIEQQEFEWYEQDYLSQS